MVSAEKSDGRARYKLFFIRFLIIDLLINELIIALPPIQPQSYHRADSSNNYYGPDNTSPIQTKHIFFIIDPITNIVHDLLQHMTMTSKKNE